MRRHTSLTGKDINRRGTYILIVLANPNTYDTFAIESNYRTCVVHDNHGTGDRGSGLAIISGIVVGQRVDSELGGVNSTFTRQGIIKNRTLSILGHGTGVGKISPGLMEHLHVAIQRYNRNRWIRHNGYHPGLGGNVAGRISSNISNGIGTQLGDIEFGNLGMTIKTILSVEVRFHTKPFRVGQYTIIDNRFGNISG